MPDPTVSQSASSLSADKERVKRLYKHLSRRADAIEIYERQVARAKEQRDELIRELLALGQSERVVARAAGISGPAVHQIKERGR